MRGGETGRRTHRDPHPPHERLAFPFLPAPLPMAGMVPFHDSISAPIREFANGVLNLHAWGGPGWGLRGLSGRSLLDWSATRHAPRTQQPIRERSGRLRLGPVAGPTANQIQSTRRPNHAKKRAGQRQRQKSVYNPPTLDPDSVFYSVKITGVYGARTRNLRRDRAAL